MLIATAPNWAEAVTAVSTGVLGLGVLIAVFQLRELRRDRHLQWIFEVGRRWDDEKLEASRAAMYALDPDGVELAEMVRRWLDDTQPDDPALSDSVVVLMRLPDFFEDVALMVNYGHLDLGLIWQSLSGPVAVTWKVWKPSVSVYRDGVDQEAFTEFEGLARTLAAYEQDRRRGWPQLRARLRAMRARLRAIF